MHGNFIAETSEGNEPVQFCVPLVDSLMRIKVTVRLILLAVAPAKGPEKPIFASSSQLPSTRVGESGMEKCLIGSIAKGKSNPIMTPIPQEGGQPPLVEQSLFLHLSRHCRWINN